MNRRTIIPLILIMCLAGSVLAVACSRGSGSTWVGTIPLDEALGNEKPTVAEFGSANCIPCKAMKPILEGIVAEYGDKLNLSFTDLRIHTEVAARYEITLMPTQIFFDSAGEEVSRHVGYWPREEVMAQLRELGFL